MNFSTKNQAFALFAIQVDVDYCQHQQEQMGADIMAGLLVGAIKGAVVDSGPDHHGELAASGIATGAAANDYAYDLVT